MNIGKGFIQKYGNNESVFWSKIVKYILNDFSQLADITYVARLQKCRPLTNFSI